MVPFVPASMCPSRGIGKVWYSVKNGYELFNRRALKITMLYENHIFQCMGKIFHVEFQRVPFEIHLTKYLPHTLKDMYFINENLRALSVFEPPNSQHLPVFFTYHCLCVQNRPVAQIPQCTSPISHNAPLCNRNVHTCAHFCYRVVHCGIFLMHCGICEMELLFMKFAFWSHQLLVKCIPDVGGRKWVLLKYSTDFGTAIL